MRRCAPSCRQPRGRWSVASAHQTLRKNMYDVRSCDVRYPLCRAATWGVAPHSIYVFEQLSSRREMKESLRGPGHTHTRPLFTRQQTESGRAGARRRRAAL